MLVKIEGVSGVRVVCNQWTGLVDWTGGLDYWAYFCFSFWHMFGKLVVAIATLNVKYAGEPVYLALSINYLRIVCNSLSWHNLYCTTTICLVMKHNHTAHTSVICIIVILKYEAKLISCM